MIQRALSGRHLHRHAADVRCHLLQRFEKSGVGLDADGAARQPLQGDGGIGEHLHRMESADQGAVQLRVLKRADFGRAAAVNDPVSRSPRDTIGHRRNGVVGHGQPDKVAGIGNRLRARKRTQAGNFPAISSRSAALRLQALVTV